MRRGQEPRFFVAPLSYMTAALWAWVARKGENLRFMAAELQVRGVVVLCACILDLDVMGYHSAMLKKVKGKVGGTEVVLVAGCDA